MTHTVKITDAYDMAQMIVDMHDIANRRRPQTRRPCVDHVEKFVALCEKMDMQPVSDAYIRHLRRMAKKAADATRAAWQKVGAGQ